MPRNVWSLAYDLTTGTPNGNNIANPRYGNPLLPLSDAEGTALYRDITTELAANNFVRNQHSL